VGFSLSRTFFSAPDGETLFHRFSRIFSKREEKKEKEES